MEIQDLPAGWAVATIGDVSVKGSQRKPSDDEEFIYVDIGSIDREKKRIATPQTLMGKDAPSRARKEIAVGDVLVSLTRPNLNAVALVEEKYDGQIASTGFEVIKPVGVDSRYIFALTRSWDFINRISGAVQGALYPAAKSADVKNYRFPLPPLAEQTRIANKLDELLAQVDTIKARVDAIPGILKRFRQSVLAAAVSGRLTEEWRRQNQPTSARDQVEAAQANKIGRLKVREKKGWDDGLELFELPNSWAWTANYKLAMDTTNAICAGPFGTIFKAKDFREEGVPIIFLRHVKEKGFNQNKPKFMDSKVWEEFHQEYSVFGGELLVTKLGDPPGECCIYPEGLGTSMVTPDVLKMDVDTEVAEKEYMMHFFNSPICKDMVRDLAFGVTRLRIDIAMFKSFPIPTPPLEEQHEIVRQVGVLFALADQIEQRLQDAQARANSFTQSIIAKAFRGELVPQDPNEDPASVLVEVLTK